MSALVRVGLDLAKHVFQVHVVDAKGAMLTNRSLHRTKLVEWPVRSPERHRLANGAPAERFVSGPAPVVAQRGRL